MLAFNACYGVTKPTGVTQKCLIVYLFPCCRELYFFIISFDNVLSSNEFNFPS